MSWQDERARFIADTLAFVRQVEQQRPVAVARSAPTAAVPEIQPATLHVAQPLPHQALPPARQQQPAVSHVMEPVAAAHPAALRMQLDDLRVEMRARAASFRISQQAIAAEREADYQRAIARVRAITAQWK